MAEMETLFVAMVTQRLAQEVPHWMPKSQLSLAMLGFY
jgi:hypothetical protein